VSGVLKDWVEAPDVDRLRQIGGHAIVSRAVEGIVGQGYEMPDVIREDYLAAYDGDRFADSARYVRSFPADLRVLAEKLSAVTTPVLNIAGAHDHVVPVGNGEYLRDHLPKGRLVVLDAGHFAYETAPEQYAAQVITWWTSGHKDH
jgi:pimeloyl-ACP methyl ester carboxylesterase